MTLEELSWIAGIVGAVAAVLGLFIAGKAIVNRFGTRQTLSIKGDNNKVKQSSRADFGK